MRQLQTSKPRTQNMDTNKKTIQHRRNTHLHTNRMLRVRPNTNKRMQIRHKKIQTKRGHKKMNEQEKRTLYQAFQKIDNLISQIGTTLINQEKRIHKLERQQQLYYDDDDTIYPTI